MQASSIRVGVITRLETPFSHRTKYSGCHLSLRWLGHTCRATYGTATHIWSMFPAGHSILCAMWFIFKYMIPEIRHDERSSRRPARIVKGNVNIQRGYENKARKLGITTITTWKVTRYTIKTRLFVCTPNLSILEKYLKWVKLLCLNQVNTRAYINLTIKLYY